MPETTGTTAAAPKPADRAVPIGLNEAALDSPSFRAMAAHFADQVDAVEKWLNGYVSSTAKLMQGVGALEDTIQSVLARATPFSDSVIDNDYTLLALRRIGEGQREFWMQVLGSSKRMEYSVVEPVRSFLLGELRNFKEIRRVLEQSQRAFDAALARFVAQSKTKEPSALREDAFTVYESRKQYIVASMDYCQLAPQFRFSLDQLLVKVCFDTQKELNRSRDAAVASTKWGHEIDRVRGWAKEMELSDGIFKRELQQARENLSEVAFEQFRPSRELEDYSTSTVAFLSSRGPVSVTPKEDGAVVSAEKQGWLFLRAASGKPVRYHWVRRWYYCRDGVFGWLMPSPQGVLQGDEIGVLLCNVKPAAGEERRFCFELKTKSQSILLQAETQKELTAWLEVFEVAKKKAFEATMERDNSSSSSPGADPAFSISAPSIPEFSVKVADAQGSAEEAAGGSDRGSNLSVPAAEGNRTSYDPNGNLSRRSFTALGREEGESGREHAARIIQKLDLHRRATFGANQENALSSSASSGCSASVSTAQALSVQTQGMLTNQLKQSVGPMLALENHKTSPLAPPTLARPPTCTQLSRTAVLVAAERGHVLDGKKLPTSVVANYWGSTVWATVHAQEQPGALGAGDDDPIGVVMSEGAQTSLTDAALAKRAVDTLPASYPAELRIQHAQFRLLFPNAPPEERLVLVFRAAWSSSLERDVKSELLAGDGRVYVTLENMYFYSQQLGLVTAYSISLDIIKEVTAAEGRDCDFIFLHLGQETNNTGYTRIAIKVFLDDLQLLQARLNLMVDNLQAEEPLETLEIIDALLNIDRAEPEKLSPSVESWEDVSAGTPVDDGNVNGRMAVAEKMLVDNIPRLANPGPKLPMKLNLPQHPVNYEPDDMREMAAERYYEISAKACFHVLFGDKSFVFPKLYFEHRAKQIAQGPWSLGEKGPRSREFHFKIDYVDVLGRSKTAQIKDIQTVDVFNDHTLYVVTHTKTAWHLPHSAFLKLVTKVVITHQAKSKCKLAIYVRVDWAKSPFLSKSLVDRQAFHDVKCDAEELAELTTDQIHKLGSKSRTSRAIQVYGHVGQQTQVVVFSPALTESRKKQAIKPRTLAAMLFETGLSFCESVVSSVIMWIFAGFKRLFDLVSAHWLLILMLLLSVAANLMLSSTETWTWWQERRAMNMMRRIGVGPDQMMSKAIYVADLVEAAGGDGDRDGAFAQHNSTCFGAFKEMLDMTNMDSPWEDAGALLSLPQSRSTARRLRRTRQRLGMYRHELLVAMRVVNSLEREMMHSEWENWLVNEQAHCEDLSLVLQEGGELWRRGYDDDGVAPFLSAMTEDRRQALTAWRDDYCGSCRMDHEAVMEARRSASI